MDIFDTFSSLQEISKLQLSKILNANPNTKYFIIQPCLIKPLERVCGVKWLKGNGVEKIFKLEAIAPEFKANSVFYMVTGEGRVFKQVVDQIRSQIDCFDCPKNKFHIIVVPKCLTLLESILEKFGLHGTVTVHSFQWLPIHLDLGILSLELPDIYSSLFVHQDSSFLPVLSKALWQLSFIIGRPQFVLGLGRYSNSLLKQFDLFCETLGQPDKTSDNALLIMDRNIDYSSVLLTPGTYAALLHEIYKINVGNINENKSCDKKLDSKCNPLNEKHPISFSLDSKRDSIYVDIKNKYFTEVTAILRDLTKKLKSETASSKEMALDEIKRYVQTQLQETRLKKQFITNHLLAAESIINTLGYRFESLKVIEQNIIQNINKADNFKFLEEFLATENDNLATLRLFCLIAITQTFSEDEINSFFQKYIQHFDYTHVYFNLIKAGFIPEPTQSSNTNKLKIPKFNTSNYYITTKNLKQIPQNPDEIDLKHPTCPSYVYGGNYIPLVTQILSMLLNSTPLIEIKSKLEIFQNLEIRNERAYPLKTKSVLVFFIGGISYAEIAACNLLETLTGAKIYFLTDKIVNGNDLMESMLTKCSKCHLWDSFKIDESLQKLQI